MSITCCPLDSSLHCQFYGVVFFLVIQAHGLILSLILFFIGYSPCSLWCDPPLLHRAYWYVWVLFSTDLCWLSLSSSISLHDNEFPVWLNSSFVEWSELRPENSDEAKLKLVVWSVVVRVIGLFLCSWLADWRNVDGSPLHRMFSCPVMRQSGNSVPSTLHHALFLALYVPNHDTLNHMQGLNGAFVQTLGELPTVTSATIDDSLVFIPTECGNSASTIGSSRGSFYPWSCVVPDVEQVRVLSFEEAAVAEFML